MKNFTIYTIGGMGKFGKENFDEADKWRKYCKKALETYSCDYRVKVVNPNDFYNFIDEPARYKTQDEVMRFDLYKLRQSDLAIVNFNDMYSLGSMAEIAIAYDRGIPVIGIDEKNQVLHPWQECMCERIFSNIDEMLDYIEDFYLR